MKTYKVILRDCTWHTFQVKANTEDEAEIVALTIFSNGDNGKEETEVSVKEIKEITEN